MQAEERQVDVGVTDPRQLVRYRLGQPAFAPWLDAIGPARAAAFADEAVKAVGDGTRPYLPRVVFLSAFSPGRKPQPR